MKKISIILSAVAMVFASCISGTDEPQIIKPNFPELQSVAAEAGESYDLTFVAENAWTISLPASSQSAAFLIYEGLPETSHSGEAGEHTVTVRIRDGVMSYAKDIVVNVELTMMTFTESIATYTVARTDFPVTVTGVPNAGMEEIVKAKFLVGGHPNSGPFADAPHTYTLRHYNGDDARYAEFYIVHDLEPSSYNYAVYVRNSNNEFERVEAGQSSGSTDETWVKFVSFGDKKEKFRLYMDIDKTIAIPRVGYEAYVNLEDENGDALVSIYHVFNPDEEVYTVTSVGLADAELSAEKGVTFKCSDNIYTMTLASPDLLTTNCLATALKFEGYIEVYGGFASGNSNLAFNHDEEKDVYYLSLSASGSLDEISRTDVLNISAISDRMDEYVINLVFDWIEEDNDNE